MGEQAQHPVVKQNQAIDQHLQHITANLLGYVRATMIAPSTDEPGVLHQHAPYCRILLKPQYRVGQVIMRAFPPEEPPVGIVMRIIEHAKKCYESSREAYMQCFDDAGAENIAEDVPAVGATSRVAIIEAMVGRIEQLVDDEQRLWATAN